MRRFVVALMAAVALVAGCDVGVPGVPPSPGRDAATFRLPALHVEPDPVNGGRIVDAHGREVLLRGANVNANVEYWAYSPALFTTYALTEEDADLLASFGWNAVRPLLSWSRVEPQPGVYDEAYLDTIEAAILLLQSRGLYAIVDLHQDAWGPSLAARPDEPCRAGEALAFGWDGAPAWATLDGDARRCVPNGTRECSPAVIASFQAFWDDAEGPGEVGIRSRYAAMLGHVAARLAQHDAVAGFEIMNGPNAIWLFPGHLDALADLYAQSIAAIRAGETAAGSPRRLVFFEPGITWADFGPGAPPDFEHDDPIVYAPHIYQGGLDATPLTEEPFERARTEALEYGGAPIFSGEWGSGPERAADPNDDYFLRHQQLQDSYRASATIWTWREACGDPHKAGDARDGRVPTVWGLFDLDCATNVVNGMRAPLAAQLTRPALRAAPGRITRLEVDDAADALVAEGYADARRSFVAFLPALAGARAHVEGAGVESFAWKPAPGGLYVSGWVRAGTWSLTLRAE
jgi:endoglycosylceramidase